MIACIATARVIVAIVAACAAVVAAAVTAVFTAVVAAAVVAAVAVTATTSTATSIIAAIAIPIPATTALVTFLATFLATFLVTAFVTLHVATVVTMLVTMLVTFLVTFLIVTFSVLVTAAASTARTITIMVISRRFLPVSDRRHCVSIFRKMLLDYRSSSGSSDVAVAVVTVAVFGTLSEMLIRFQLSTMVTTVLVVTKTFRVLQLPMVFMQFIGTFQLLPVPFSIFIFSAAHAAAAVAVPLDD